MTSRGPAPRGAAPAARERAGEGLLVGLALAVVGGAALALWTFDPTPAPRRTARGTTPSPEVADPRADDAKPGRPGGTPESMAPATPVEPVDATPVLPSHHALAPETAGPSRRDPDADALDRAVAGVLAELEALHADVGELDWEAARSLIERRHATQKALEDRLAALGPGGAAALGRALERARPVRARLLLISALGRIADDGASETLATALRREPDSAFAIRRELVAALGRRSGPEATSALAASLGGDADSRLRFAAAQGLAGRAQAVPALGVAIRADRSVSVRCEAVRSVGLAGGEAALSLLADVAADEATDFAVRESAIQELGRSFGAGALGPLESLLASSDERVRASAVAAVARVPGETSLAVVRGAAEGDPSPAVRARARRALAQAGR